MRTTGAARMLTILTGVKPPALSSGMRPIETEGQSRIVTASFPVPSIPIAKH
jgi:hypothetical protein